MSVLRWYDGADKPTMVVKFGQRSTIHVEDGTIHHTRVDADGRSSEWTEPLEGSAVQGALPEWMWVLLDSPDAT